MKNQTTDCPLMQTMGWELDDLREEMIRVGLDPDEEAAHIRAMIQLLIAKAIVQQFLVSLLQQRH